MTIPTPGLHLDVPNDTYHHEWEAVSNSQLKRFARSPAHMMAPYSPSDSMILGSAVHDAVLLPEEFEKRYVRYTDTKTRGAKAYTAWQAANPGMTGLTPDEYELIDKIKTAVNLHPVAGQLVTGGAAESSGVWRDEVTGTLCKCRPDYAHPDKGAIIDLKTTRDASAGPFGRDAARYEYHQQGAFYLDGYSAASGQVYDTFIFLCVETDDPVSVALYVMTADQVEKGRALYQSRLDAYAEWVASGRAWDGYPTEIQELQLPAW